jgi:ribosomal-protein-alanine N-acetyltransferase
MKPPKIIETRRLLLRPPTLDDAEDIFDKYAQDPEVTRYMVWLPHEQVETTKEFLERCVNCWEEGNAFPWVMELKSDGPLMGMLEMRLVGYKADFGYGIARQYWGNGYTTEAVQALVQWALEQEDIYRVWAVCDLENIGSARVLEKAGLEREGILRRYSIHPLISIEPRDCYSYSIVK